MLVCPICEKEYKCNKCAYDDHVNKHIKEQGKNLKDKDAVRKMIKMKLKVARAKKIKKVKVKVPDKNAELDMMAIEDKISSDVRQKKDLKRKTLSSQIGDGFIFPQILLSALV